MSQKNTYSSIETLSYGETFILSSCENVHRYQCHKVTMYDLKTFSLSDSSKVSLLYCENVQHLRGKKDIQEECETVRRIYTKMV